MKRFVAVACLVGLVWLCSSGHTWADSSKSQNKSLVLPTSGISKALKDVRTGTKKLVRDTLDVVTLKKLREKKTPKLDPPSKPWLNNTSKKKKEEKKSLWSSLFPSKKKPKRVETMKDFVGLKRPR